MARSGPRGFAHRVRRSEEEIRQGRIHGHLGGLPRARFSVPYAFQTVTGSVAHGDGYTCDTDNGIDFSQQEVAECAHWETIDTDNAPLGNHHARIDADGLYLCRAFVEIGFLVGGVVYGPANFMGFADFNATSGADDSTLDQPVDQRIFTANDQTHGWQGGTTTTAFAGHRVTLVGVLDLFVGDKLWVTVSLGTDDSTADFAVIGGPVAGVRNSMSFMDLTQLASY